ncbi:hypothetical protein J4Q44_G00106790 [Coregonus suidteri]|uniref:Uncharacterized protein n=1 Tax=Coregonus suidteri TaxID=861788 RepID=A0AAN8LVH9_9TELE
MAMTSRKIVYNVLKVFLLFFIQQTLCETPTTSLYLSQKLSEDGYGIDMRSVTPTKSSTQQARLHPGVIAAVIFVTLAAVLAAVFIIRKYCFPRSEATYRYSVLRRMEAEGSGYGTEEEEEEEEEDGRGPEPYTLGEDSDEDMLE